MAVDPVALRAFVINLDRRADRLGVIAADLDALGISWERVPGVLIEEDALQAAEGHLLSAGQVGCWMAHQHALRRIVESELPIGLILEDDALLDPSLDWLAFSESLRVFLSSSTVDLLQVGWISDGSPWSPNPTTDVPWFRRTHLPSPHNEIEVVADFLSGTHAYVVTRNGASRLLGLNIPVAFAADDFFAHMARTTNWYPFRVCRLTRSLANQRSRSSRRSNIDSDIKPVMPPLSRNPVRMTARLLRSTFRGLLPR